MQTTQEVLLVLEEGVETGVVQACCSSSTAKL